MATTSVGPRHGDLPRRPRTNSRKTFRAETQRLPTFTLQLTCGVDDSGRIGQLARFGAGLAKAQDLVNAAKTPAEKTEAAFYAAMDRRVAGDTNAANLQLRTVVDSNGIDLMEVAIARDLLDGPRATVGGPIPAEAAQP